MRREAGGGKQDKGKEGDDRASGFPSAGRKRRTEAGASSTCVK